MVRHRRSSPEPVRPIRSLRRRWTVAAALLLAGAGMALWFAPRLGSAVCRKMAAHRMSQGAVGAAKRWLARAARLHGGRYELDLMKAVCDRELGLSEDWSESVQAAGRHGAPEERIAREARLAAIQAGRPDKDAGKDMDELNDGTGSPRSVVAAFLRGYLGSHNVVMARTLLENWSIQAPDDLHTDYLWGIYLRAVGDLEEARERLQNTLRREPGHELARVELAGVFEDKACLALALQEYERIQAVGGEARTAVVGQARVLRKLGRLEEARHALGQLVEERQASFAVRAEMAQIELEAGAYEEADRWFARLGRVEPVKAEVLSGAAIAHALRNKPSEAESLLAEAAAYSVRRARLYDLRVRVAADPGDSAAARELDKLSRSPVLAPGSAVSGGSAAEGSRGPAVPSASELYVSQCAGCHGTSGDGTGRAARHLFPRPRNLRTGRFRLVSARNGVATLDDLDLVLQRGMPGTSMPSFPGLQPTQRKALCEEVVGFQRAGLREQLLLAARAEGDPADEGEVQQSVDRCTTPGELIRLPATWDAPLGALLSEGRRLYVNLGCQNCHGDRGDGSDSQALFDEQGEPTRARDLVREPFKGGREPQSVYVRIALGMPGTPHPAVPALHADALVALTQYACNLSPAPLRSLTNHERSVLAESRAYLQAIREPHAQ